MCACVTLSAIRYLTKEIVYNLQRQKRQKNMSNQNSYYFAYSVIHSSYILISIFYFFLSSLAISFSIYFYCCYLLVIISWQTTREKTVLNQQCMLCVNITTCFFVPCICHSVNLYYEKQNDEIKMTTNKTQLKPHQSHFMILRRKTATTIKTKQENRK